VQYRTALDRSEGQFSKRGEMDLGWSEIQAKAVAKEETGGKVQGELGREERSQKR
jgi:hypothetical protein